MFSSMRHGACRNNWRRLAGSSQWPRCNRAGLPCHYGGCTVIATSGRYAMVTPFSSNLPTMDMVEIGDVAIVYDDPISLQTYLLVMRNALLIPMMDHNLVPPFLLRMAGLQVDETPKYQLALPTFDNHSIYDSETKMCIHLKLKGIFSYFPA